MRIVSPFAALALVAALAAAVPGRGADALDAPAAARPPPDVVVEVGGLSCPFCAYGIEKKFVEREEVDSVFVALERNEVRLWLVSGRELSDEAVRRTVERAGFSPGAVRRPAREGMSRR